MVTEIVEAVLVEKSNAGERVFFAWANGYERNGIPALICVWHSPLLSGADYRAWSFQEVRLNIGNDGVRGSLASPGPEWNTAERVWGRICWFFSTQRRVLRNQEVVTGNWNGTKIVNCAACAIEVANSVYVVFQGDYRAPSSICGLHIPSELAHVYGGRNDDSFAVIYDYLRMSEQVGVTDSNSTDDSHAWSLTNNSHLTAQHFGRNNPQSTGGQ